MEIGNDDFYEDDLLDEEISTEEQNIQTEEGFEEEVVEEPSSTPQTQDDYIVEFLKSRGIEDPNKIKFETEDGNLEEKSWDSLDKDEKLNILNFSNENPDTDLDDSEIELINAIRESNLTPIEYLQSLQKQTLDNYIQNSQPSQTYRVDDYSDEELFVMDLISRSEEITEDEAIEALERAKSNEILFKKQIGAIRNQYKKQEEEDIQYAKLRQEQEAQDNFNRFAERIEDAIINFESPAGGDIEMSDEDMNNLYTFITGTDNAGNNWFNKALQDPRMVVQMAWYLLHGEKMISDINDYYQKQITEVRKNSFNEGLKASEKKDKPQVIYNPKNNNNLNHIDYSDDLDDEF